MSQARKWATGCAVGCGVLALLAVAVVMAGYYVFRGAFDTIETAEHTHDRLVEELGDVGAYTPPAHGAVSPGTLESFLEVRAELADEEAAVKAAFDRFPVEALQEEDPSFGAVVGMMRAMAGVIRPVTSWMEARDSALLERGMPLGEYLWIYTTAYHSWLGRAPDDVPAAFTGEGAEQIRIEGDSPLDPDQLWARYRHTVRALVSNQLRTLPADDPPSPRRLRLEDELEALAQDRRHVLFADDGLPEAMVVLYEPHREALERTYSSATNALELPRR